MGFLRFVGWTLCVVYSTVPLFWIVIHPNIESWRCRKQQGRPAYKALIPLWMGMWIMMGAVSWPWHGVLLWRSSLAWLAGALLLSTGLFLYARARHGFSPLQLSGQHEIESDQHRQELVIAGIRRKVRHPIYLGHLCEMLGWSIGTGMAALFGLTAFAIVTGAIMIRMEDAELRQRFGEQFETYRREVPAIVPRLW
jgi:protein-S-isoprenylcysteine O-methyltransferase Ste14